MSLKELWFSKDDEVFKNYKVIENESDENHLKGLSKVNIFIGPNNSGKSRFMRNLFSGFSQINEAKFENKDDKVIMDSFPQISNQIIDIPLFDLSTDEDLQRRLVRFNGEKTLFSFLGVEDFEVLKSYAFLQFFYSKLSSTDYKPENPNLNHDNLIKIRKSLLNLYRETINKFNPHLTLIPTMRTTREIGRDKVFYSRYSKDYFKSSPLISELFSGESLFNELREQLYSGSKFQSQVRDFERFLSKTFYDRKDITLSSPEYKDGTPNNLFKGDRDKRIINTDILIRIGSEEKLIPELGDGIEAITLMTFPLFTRANKDHFYFIDEPEQNLHPGFQRIFLETLLQERFSKTQTSICTHSNHFLDLSLDYPEDISIFKFQKKGEGENATFEIRKVAGQDKTVLQSIGARNSSVFLSNCTIWVEGITDRLYIRKWLEIYQNQLNDGKVYHEDIHYSFVEFGGTNITHWSFLDNDENINIESLCGSPFVVSDNDGAGLNKQGEPIDEESAKYRRHRALESKLNSGSLKSYHRLGRREIENLLTPEILKKTITHFERNKSGNKNLEPEFNSFKYKDYANEYLGGFIDRNVLPESKREVKRYGKDANASTIQRKVDFCRVAIDCMDKEQDLSEDVKNLMKNLYGFIERHNQ